MRDGEEVRVGVQRWSPFAFFFLLFRFFSFILLRYAIWHISCGSTYSMPRRLSVFSFQYHVRSNIIWYRSDKGTRVMRAPTGKSRCHPHHRYNIRLITDPHSSSYIPSSRLCTSKNVGEDATIMPDVSTTHYRNNEGDTKERQAASIGG